MFQFWNNELEQEKPKYHNPHTPPQSSYWKGSQNLWQSCKNTVCIEITWLPFLPGLYPKD